MPTYEYRCDNCETITEQECRHTERYDAPDCSTCGGETELIISTSTFSLRGGGWAQDGYTAPSKKSS